jgi:DNA-binding LytR/AlgR family response regulator
MPGIRIVLVEDDWIIAKEISYSLQDLGFEVSGSFDNGEEAIAAIRDLRPDLVLLDIDIAGELTGIDVARHLKTHTQIPYIFLTALADPPTIHQAKLAEPFAYLVKPVRPESLYSTIELTLHQAAARKDATPPLKEALDANDSIFVKVKQRMEKIRLQDILWVEASDIYALICTSAGKHLLNTSLKAVEERFPQSTFIRVHRSFIVNLDKIDALEDDGIAIGSQIIPIGKTFREKLMHRLSFL